MSEAAPREGDLVDAYAAVRDQTRELCEPLAIEDYGVQPTADASPPKWHLAHTTWFFETFLLKRLVRGYQPFHDQFEYLFNSYYEGVGEPYPRNDRGHLSRPTVQEICAYRDHVDDAMRTLIENGIDDETESGIVLGLQHEKQHQELIVTDMKFNFGHNPLKPAYREDLVTSDRPAEIVDLAFLTYPGGAVEIGAQAGEDSFCFDNETPRHNVWLEDFAIARRLVTNGEYQEFIDAGGYDDPTLWLSDGWAETCSRGWCAPEYWRFADGRWLEYTLRGETALDPQLPVTHVSFYEADAFARWAGARLPTEFEWEHVCGQVDTPAPNLADTDRLHPARARGAGPTQLIGDCWEWTASSYGPYPKFVPLPGTLGEYNAKFMANQMVLRGGSCATPADHIRKTYRNFFYAKDRWQFTGIRLAKDAGD